VSWRRKDRLTTTPSRVDVNVRAIPVLKSGGWKLLSAEDAALIGAVPKDYLVYGLPRSRGSRRTEAAERRRTDGPVLAGISKSYVAKRGRYQLSALECTTEEIISKIGAMLPVDVATSKLVRLRRADPFGPRYEVRFLSRDFVDPARFVLRHGMELVADYFDTVPDDVVRTFRFGDKREERRFYTVGNMLTILRSLYGKDAEVRRRLEVGFAKMLAFDAVVGAPDRHLMNWGLLLPRKPEHDSVRFAPLFDTARGLFTNIADEHLARHSAKWGRQGYIERYARKSRPVLGDDRGRRVNHFGLVARIAREHRELLPPMREVSDGTSVEAMERMLQRRFRRIITPFRLHFIADLLTTRVDKLQEELKE